jgi:ribonucleoside-diphosphate reductase alpha chain
MERIAQEGHIHFAEVPQEVQDVFRTAHDISPEWHVRMQAAFQEHVDSAISKTTNFPHAASREQVRQIYELAFELGCKGVTVYRDGSRPMQVLSTGKTGKEGQTSEAEAKETESLRLQLADAREKAHRLEGEIEVLKANMTEQDKEAAASRHKRQRPSVLKGYSMKMNSPLGDLYVTINEDHGGRPFEVFCTLGKAGGAAMADSEAIGRLISLSLRSGIPISAVRDQLRGISCDRAVGVGPNKVLSAPDAIAQAIVRYLIETEGVQEELPISAPAPSSAAGSQPNVQPSYTGHRSNGDHVLGACPACNASQLAYEEGCKKCYVCGFSECG